MKKVINYRPLLAIFLGISIGAICASAVFCGSRSDIFERILILIAILLFLALQVLLLNDERYARVIRMSILFALSMVLGICMILGYVGKKINYSEAIFNQVGRNSVNVTIQARVQSTATKNNSTSAVLSNIKLDGKSYGKFNIRINFGNSNIITGDNLEFEAVIFSNEIVDEKINSSALNKNILYYGYATGSSINIYKNNANLIEIVQIKTDSTLKEHCGNNYGIIKALLLGDKSEMEQDVYENFKISGLAHILSISGLHVSFIAMMIFFVLKKLKANTKVQFFATAIFLLLYCALCGFISSVVRASIMSLCLMLSNLIGKRSDHFSSISLAGIILLLIKPSYILDIGFQLSFLSVFGILLFATPITKFFKKIHLPYFIASSFAVTLSATILTLPVLINQFGYISPISLIANLIIIPLFSVFFAVLFIAFLLNLFLPMGFAFSGLSVVFSGISAVTAILAQVGIIKIKKLPATTVAFYYGMLLATSTLHINTTLVKKCICIFCSVVCIVNTLGNNTLSNFNFTSQLYALKNIDNSCLIKSTSGKNILVYASNDCDYDLENLTTYFNNIQIGHIDTIVVPNYSDNQNEVITGISSNFNTEKIILPYSAQSNSYNLCSQINQDIIVNYAGFYNARIDKNFVIYAHKVNNEVKAYSIFRVTSSIDFKLLILYGANYHAMVLCDSLTLSEMDSLINDITEDGTINYLQFILCNDIDESVANLMSANRNGTNYVIIKNRTSLTDIQMLYLDSLKNVSIYKENIFNFD